MFWKTLHLTVNLTFLLLAFVIIGTLFKDGKYREDLADYKLSQSELKQEVLTINQNNFSYLENKLNRLSSGQDSYQISTSRRLDILESRVRALDETNKGGGNRIINTNAASYHYTDAVKEQQ